jgi:flagellar biosynthesis component FlhA
MVLALDRPLAQVALEMLLTYRLITALLIVLLVAALFRRRPLGEQVTAGLVLVPLVLRLLLIK